MPTQICSLPQAFNWLENRTVHITGFCKDPWPSNEIHKCLFCNNMCVSNRRPSYVPSSVLYAESYINPLKLSGSIMNSQVSL